MLKRVAIAALLAVVIGPALAQAPSAEEIIRRLMQPKISEGDLKSNAVQIEGARRRTAPAPGTGPSIDLAVNFETGSATLTPDARIVLDNLGQALADPALSASRFRIAGHTDARGSDAYNLALSKRRAQSVADYLKTQHRVEAPRLNIEGYGRRQLLDAANPASAVNRRVQVTNLGS